MSSAKEYTENELIKIRAIQMDMYREVRSICQRHSIPHTAIAGSVLGAIRHHGYIPWDDDLDIAMMREDYNRFLKYAEKEINPKFFIQNYYTDPYYGNYFTKIRCNNTLFVQNIDKNDKSHHGIFIDIFPIDRLTDCIEKRESYRRQLMFYFQLYMAKCNKGISGETDSLSGKAKLLLRRFLHIILAFASKEKLFYKVDALCQKFNTEKTETLMIAILYAMKGQHFEEKTMFPPVVHSFEEDTIFVPYDSNRYLSESYGNYMELPPIEKRINHRPYKLSFSAENEDKF